MVIPKSYSHRLFSFSFSILLLFCFPAFFTASAQSLNIEPQNEMVQVRLNQLSNFSDSAWVLVDSDSFFAWFQNGASSIPILEDFEGLKFIQVPAGSAKGLFYFSQKGGTLHASHLPLWLSILPPLIAIGLALFLREALFSLFAGVWVGAFLVLGASPWAFFPALLDVGQVFILDSLEDRDHLSVIVFSLFIGGMVAIVSKNGGMAGIVNHLSRLAKNSTSAQFTTWGMGLLLFFDDYANSLIVGNTMRPVTDRFRISREKLAYLVDSTAAPVAAIAFVTTWIGAELGYIETALEAAHFEKSAYSMFLGSLQYAYYPVFAIVFMALLIGMKKDFGPMLKAERLARAVNQITATELGKTIETAAFSPKPNIPHLWHVAFIPVFTVVVTTICALVYSGYDAEMWTDEQSFLLNLSDTIGNADSFSSLMYGSSLGLFLAIILSRVHGLLSLEETVTGLLDGFKAMLPAILILVLAWSLAAVTGKLHTAAFLTGLLDGAISPYWIPLLTFLLAAVIAFSTGSSWSTMAILFPLIVPAAYAVSQSAGMGDAQMLPVLYNVIASVLAGAVLGDHCSPISDTTILSSLASQCDHIAHVKTQMPYALAAGLVAAVSGGLVFAIGLPWYIGYLVGFLFLWAIVRFAGRPVEEFNG